MRFLVVTLWCCALVLSLSAQSGDAWLTDAQGRSYRLEQLPRNQARKIADDRVRTIWGVQADLAREDEQFFYIKIYKVGPPRPATPKPMLKPSPRPPAERVRPPRASQRLRWTPYGAGLPTTGQWRRGLAAADMNADGRLDLVAGPARKTLRAPSTFVQESGAWAPWTKARYPARPYDYGDLAVGDFSGDGVPDVVLGVHLRGLIALRGAAGGQYEDASQGLPFATRADDAVFSSRAVLLMDCNADARPDIVALGEGPRLMAGRGVNGNVATGISTFVQQADGTWRAAGPSAPAGFFGGALAAADVDGDGIDDLVTAPGILGDRHLWHQGDGRCGWKSQTIEAARLRSYVTAIAAADLDGDRRAEIVLGYTDVERDEPFHGVDVLTRSAAGEWSRSSLVRASGRERIEAIAMADLDGDGRKDVAVAGAGGVVSVYLRDRTGGFTRERQTIPPPDGCSAAALVLGDLDRDGLRDLVVSYAQESSTTTAGVCRGEGALATWRTQRR